MDVSAKWSNQEAQLRRVGEASAPVRAKTVRRRENLVELSLEQPYDVPVWTPVEVTVPGYILLGISAGQVENRVSVSVEHQVDCERLELILNKWSEEAG